MMSISDAFEIKQTVKISEDDLNGHVVKLKSKSAEILVIADSVSTMSFPNETTAVFLTIPPEDTAQNLTCYNGKIIIPKGRLILAIDSGG